MTNRFQHRQNWGRTGEKYVPARANTPPIVSLLCFQFLWAATHVWGKKNEADIFPVPHIAITTTTTTLGQTRFWPDLVHGEIEAQLYFSCSLASILDASLKICQTQRAVSFQCLLNYFLQRVTVWKWAVLYRFSYLNRMRWFCLHNHHKLLYIMSTNPMKVLSVPTLKKLAGRTIYRTICWNYKLVETL